MFSNERNNECSDEDVIKALAKHSSARWEYSDENFIMIQLTISKRRNEKQVFNYVKVECLFIHRT